MQLIDTHAHLNDDRFAKDLPATVERAQAQGVSQMIAVGICVESSRRCIALAKRYPGIWATVGLHPNDLLKAPADAWEQILTMSREPKVVGVGETGLDRYRKNTPFEVQCDWFKRHLELGRERDLPVVIHCREADADLVPLLREQWKQHGPIRAVMHSFCGTATTATTVLEMGLDISFAGMVTYKTAQELRAVAATVPLDRIMVETDCPYLAPMPNRGRRNEPAYVRFTAACLAEVHSMPLEEFAEQTTKNARRLFKLPESASAARHQNHES
jgi:TatD DNase family protein